MKQCGQQHHLLVGGDDITLLLLLTEEQLKWSEKPHLVFLFRTCLWWIQYGSSNMLDSRVLMCYFMYMLCIIHFFVFVTCYFFSYFQDADLNSETDVLAGLVCPVNLGDFTALFWDNIYLRISTWWTTRSLVGQLDCCMVQQSPPHTRPSHFLSPTLQHRSRQKLLVLSKIILHWWDQEWLAQCAESISYVNV